MRLLRLALLPILLLALASCDQLRQFGQTISNLKQVQEGLAKKYSHHDINVQITNGTALNITFINSALQDTQPAERLAAGRAIAESAYQLYPSRSNLQMVNVFFATQKTYLLFFHFSQTFQVYSLQPGKDPVGPASLSL